MFHKAILIKMVSLELYETSAMKTGIFEILLRDGQLFFSSAIMLVAKIHVVNRSGNEPSKNSGVGVKSI